MLKGPPPIKEQGLPKKNSKNSAKEVTAKRDGVCHVIPVFLRHFTCLDLCCEKMKKGCWEKQSCRTPE